MYIHFYSVIFVLFEIWLQKKKGISLRYNNQNSIKRYKHLPSFCRYRTLKICRKKKPG